MAKIVNEYDLTGKSLMITARKDGFRRGGISHSTTETLHSVDEFTDEQLGQIMAESGKNLIVWVVEVKGMEDSSKPATLPDDAVARVIAAIVELEAAGEKINVANLTAKVGFKVTGELKDQALAELEKDKE